MPVADSMYAPLVDDPTSEAKTHDSASTSIGFSTSGKLPSLSSMLPAAPTPTSVPSVSRNDISTSVSSTGRKLSRSTPAMSRRSAMGASEYSPVKGIAKRPSGAGAKPMA